MIRLVILEWKILWRDRRLPAALLCFALLGTATLWTTAHNNAVTARTAADAERMEYERWLAQGSKYAHAAAHYGMHVFRPTTRLQNFDPGVTAFVGETVFLEAHVQDPLLYRPADDRIADPGLSQLTPASLIFTFTPLLVLLLGFNSASAEQGDPGWLAQVSARGTLRLPSSKVLAIALPMAACCLVLLSCASVAVGRYSPQITLPDERSRWLALSLLCAVSILVCSAVTVACSSLSRSASRSLAILLAGWVFFYVLLPRGIAAGAAWLHPTISQQQLASDIHAATGEGEDSDPEDQLKRTLLQRYHVSSLEDLPVEWDGLRRQAAENAGNTIFDAFWGKLFRQYSAQQAAAAAMSVLSPPTATGILSETLAGSRVQDHTAFIEQAEAHRRLIQRTMNQELSHKRSADAGARPNSGPELWSRVPSFHFVALSLRGQVDRDRASIWFALLGVLLQGVLAASLFAAALRRRQNA